MILRDYNSDAENALSALDPQFNFEDTSMFKEHKPADKDPIKEKMATVDAQVSVLTQESRKAQFEADCLALARDLAQVGSMCKVMEKSERAKHQEKVLHMRNQNKIGAAVVSEFMMNNLSVHAGVVRDQTNVISRVRFMDKNDIVMILLESKTCSLMSMDFMNCSLSTAYLLSPCSQFDTNPTAL